MAQYPIASASMAPGIQADACATLRTSAAMAYDVQDLCSYGGQMAAMWHMVHVHAGHSLQMQSPKNGNYNSSGQGFLGQDWSCSSERQHNLCPY